MSKITDYPLKSSPASDDIVLLVDVHDTSQNPAGTTKKATVGSLGAGGGGGGNVSQSGSSAAAGILKVSAGTSTNIADYTGGTGLLKSSSSGVVSPAVAGTDYAAPTSGSSLLKGNGSGGFANAVASTDYAPATSGSALLKGNGSGGFSSATAGTDYVTPAGSGASLTGLTQSQISGLTSALAALAPLASPAFTGTPTAPTRSALTSNTDIATTAYADAAVGVETTRAETAEGLLYPKAGGTLTGGMAPAAVTLTQSAGSVAVNAASGNLFILTLTASGWTISNPTGAVSDGQVIRIRLVQDSTGSRTVSWGSAYNWGTTAGSANSAPLLTTTALKTDVLAFEWDAAISKWCSLGAAFPQGY
jgi:hypothetical protein